MLHASALNNEILMIISKSFDQQAKALKVCLGKGQKDVNWNIARDKCTVFIDMLEFHLEGLITRDTHGTAL